MLGFEGLCLPVLAVFANLTLLLVEALCIQLLTFLMDSKRKEVLTKKKKKMGVGKAIPEGLTIFIS